VTDPGGEDPFKGDGYAPVDWKPARRA
jgi:hypothetical protein